MPVLLTMPTVVLVTTSASTTFGSNVFGSTVSLVLTRSGMTAFFLLNSPRTMSGPTTFFGGATTKKIFIVGRGSLS